MSAKKNATRNIDRHAFATLQEIHWPAGRVDA
jgi:hypothetical protein